MVADHLSTSLAYITMLHGNYDGMTNDSTGRHPQKEEGGIMYK